MKKLLLILTAFALVLSCSSDETSTPVTPPAPIVKYTITLSAGEGGTVSTTGGEYEAGQTVSVTATPQGEYVFTSWSDGNTNATRTITVNSNTTLTANFEKRKYPLTVNFDGEGEVIEEIVNSGRTTEYDSGTTVKLTAQAAAEWVFIGWTGDIESTEESVQIVIGEPKEVTATFEKKKYPLSVNIEGEGEVLEEIIEADRTTDYDSGTTIKLTAEPADEWLFTGWSGDIGDIDPTENPIQLTIIESKTVTATFEKKKYPLTVNIEGEGEVLEEIVNTGRTTDYDSGTTVKLTAVPAEGWEFAGWEGAIDGKTNPQQLLISEPKTVSATFNFPEIESNLFKESYSYFLENYNVGDIIDIDGVSFEIKSFSKFDNEGWINFMNSQYGISVALNHIKLSPIDCYNSDLITELFFNSENGDFLMVRFGNLNFVGDVFHFLKKRFYREGFNPPFNDNSQAKHFNNTDLLFYNVGKYIENLKTHEFSYYDITFKASEGGFFELKNLKTSEVNIIKNDTTYLNITDCQKFSVKAIPYDNFHFNGWSKPILDTVQMIPSINLNISSSLLVESKFIPKISTNKSVISEHNCLSGDNPTVTDDMLDFRASENFIVWWDKKWFHNNDAKEIIHWAEFTYSKAIEYGMRSYIESALTNIYIHHVSNDSGNIDVFSDGWGQGAANCEVASIITHPYSTGNSIKIDSEFNVANLRKIRINPLFPKLNVHHEVFHVMQQYASMNNTFPYSGDFGWYTEATAEWFEVKYRQSPDVWRHAPYYLLNPNLRLWDFTWDDNILNKHRYGASLFLFYLEWNNIVEESFFGKSYYSGTSLTPQEYLYNNIPNLNNHFLDFAGKASVIDFQHSVPQIKIQKQIYLDKTGGIDTQFELVLNDEGTDEVFTPSRKIEGWAYQTIKLSTTKESKYTFKFNSNLTGSQGGVADFNIIIVKEKAGEFNYEKKYIEKDSIIFEFLSEVDTRYYFTIVNTPNKLKGNDQYDYSIELIKID